MIAECHDNPFHVFDHDAPITSACLTLVGHTSFAMLNRWRKTSCAAATGVANLNNTVPAHNNQVTDGELFANGERLPSCFTIVAMQPAVHLGELAASVTRQ